MIDLTSKVALITGGSRGIGAACAILMGKAGAKVLITYQKNKKAALHTLKQIRQFSINSMALECEVDNYKDVKQVVDTIVKKFGKIDILVNNAGIWKKATLEEMDDKQWDETININLKGTMNFCRAVVPFMKKQKQGRIINISSTAGQRGEAFHSHYAASKGGVISFTKSIAVELIKFGIYVNCVAPGWVITDMTTPALKNKHYKKTVISTIPRGKIATPEEIAGPILFLASDLANNIVGEILNVNGGSVLCG